MKRILFAFIVFTSVFSLYSQEEDGLLIYRHNAKPLLVVLDDISNISHSDSIQIIDLKPEWTAKVKTPVSSIDSMVFVDIDTLYNVKYACLSCPDDNHPHAIDLGLPSGTLWACCNVGANNPEEFGEYYNWGMTRSTIDATDPYSYYEHFFDVNREYVKDIGDDIAGTEYDVAYVKWGSSWRMPTSEQFQELFDNVINAQELDSEYSGDSHTSVKLYGPNWNSISIPTSGGFYTMVYHDEDGVDEYRVEYFEGGERQLYWSSTRSTLFDSSESPEIRQAFANCGEFPSNLVTLYYKWYSLPVRPVSSHTEKPHIEIGCPDDHHPHAIDLGLPSGTKWACCNVGASKPVEYGGYYAWGETEEKDYYDWKTYSFCDGNSYSCYSIGDDIAGTQYDVAHVRWGDSWKMSSIEQIQELCENCSWQWLSINGINGQLVTGPNGNIIFLPASGRYFQDKFLYDGVEGEYWSSSISPDAKQDARLLSFSPNVWTWISLISRAFGQTVRPVCP